MEKPRNLNDAEKQEPQQPSESFLVEWDGDKDPLDPRTWAPARKWFYICLVATGSMMVTATSSLYSAAYQQVEREFNSSEEVAILGLSLYVLGLSVGPMAFGPLSEACLSAMELPIASGRSIC